MLDRRRHTWDHVILTPKAAKSYSFVEGCCFDDGKKYDQNGKFVCFDYETPITIPSRFIRGYKIPKNNGVKICLKTAKSKGTPPKNHKYPHRGNIITQPLIRKTQEIYRGCVRS